MRFFSHSSIHHFAAGSLCVVALVCSFSLRAAEIALPPVTDGLELRLEAREINSVRRARGLPLVNDGGSVGLWHDLGAGGHDFVQRIGDAMPVYHEPPGGGAAAYVRFDGRDDFLQWAGSAAALRGATIMLVAAPRGSIGYFPGLVSLTERERNDYTSGMNVDLGPAASVQFSSLNVEGAGFGGAVNLLRQAYPLGTFHVITVVVPDAPGEVELFVDGQPQGKRPRDARAIGMEEVAIGARIYSNDAKPPRVAGFLNGDLAAVHVFGRPLKEDERRAMEGFLRERCAPLFRIRGLDDSPERYLSGDGPAVPLIYEPPGAPGGPPIQFLAPGFKARGLPLELKNINNLEYRRDGTLVALGYDGAIYLLRDTNGDGLEDKADTFWEAGKFRGPIGMALTPPGYSHGNGVFVASKGKISLILDEDGDDRGDTEKIVATGWKEITQAVDALGVALDKGGSLYFGLGTTDYTNAYLIDPVTGKSRYAVADERGTIQRVSPDFSTRETVCSGVRFTVSLKFNAAGDLFCTDQEGQTWLPGGNPFDELLQIQPGRHYGFPPKHPVYLSNVFDEPSVALYGPEHQSTCGLMFNEAEEAKPIFGPDHWRGDAFVAGYSRGRIFRTQLAKTEFGYVSRVHTFACLGMLPVETVLSPEGAMVVACHSGDPDWGSGPEGRGKLFKIAYDDKTAPQPLAVWAQGPMEVCITFDREIDPASLDKLKKETTITYGKYVRVGDAFESFRPGYQLVQEQMATPRYRLNVIDVSFMNNKAGLILTTQPHSMRGWYSVRLPNLAASAGPESRAIEMDYTLNGWGVKWRTDSGAEVGSGYLCNPDAVLNARMMMENSREVFWLSPPNRGWNAFQSVIHPPDGAEFLIVHASGPFEVTWGQDIHAATDLSGFQFTVKLPFPEASTEQPIQIRTQSALPPTFGLSWTAKGDPHERVLPLDACFLPWAPPAAPPQVQEVQPTETPKIEGGNWLRGQRLFFGEARCYQCHQLRGEGRSIGPDLRNLIYRDAASVSRDIRQPSAAINPDFVTYNVRLESGDELNSLLKSDPDGMIRAFDSNGEERIFAAHDVAEYRSSSISTMPEGLADALSEKQFADLLTFLLEPPPLMPPNLAGAPPARSKAEIEKILGHELSLGGAEPNAAPKPMRIVLVAGAQDHGPGEHDYPAWQKVWQKLLQLAEGVEVKTAWEWPSDDDLQWADVIVFYCWSHPWSVEKAPAIQAYLDNGGGLVLLHAATIVDRDFEAFEDVIGLVAEMGPTGFRHGEMDLDFSVGGDSPITRDIKGPVHFHDESYWPLRGDESRVNVLATGVEDGKPRPLMWTHQSGKGRVFCSILGHYSWTFDDPIFRIIILRAIAWTAGQPENRFAELATAGVNCRVD